MSHAAAKLVQLRESQKLGYWGERIVTELEYACKISEVNNKKYDCLIDHVTDFINEKVGKESCISKEAALEAEKILSEISPEAKKYKMICTAHAHIDMNWMWRWDETVAITLDTFRTMLDLMKEYPDFTFSQSQASVYRIVEEYDKSMLEEIRQRVKEGRWEVTASTWVEADKNMPNGESHTRHILYTKNYLSQLLNIKQESLNIDFEPDTFGHSINIPEILSKGGVKYYYHCRGFEKYNLYRWESPSGSSVTVYREPGWYLGSIEYSMALYVPEFCQKHNMDTMLKVYGVGDHGGGPTRRDIEKILDMNTWPVFPEIRFGTFSDYFTLTDKIANQLPLVKDELNFIFTGCYTSQTRIKMANRISEAVLNEAEAFNAVSSLCEGYGYSPEEFAEAWKNVLFNHFHDIIPGSGIIDTREYALGLFQRTMAIANNRKNMSIRSIASQIDTSQFINENEDLKWSTSEGAGVGFGIKDFKITQCGRSRGKVYVFNFFNSSCLARSEAAEIVAWDWRGDINRIVFKDMNGNVAEHQLLDHGFNEYWGHNYLRALVKVNVPPSGYNTYIMTEVEVEDLQTPFPNDPRVEKPDEYIMENDLIKVVFDTRNASILSMVDKSSGKEYIDSKRPAGIFRYIEEDDNKGMTAWIIGRYMNVQNLTENVKIRNFEGKPGSIRQSISYEINFKDSKLNVVVSLDYDSPRLNFSVECDWHEIGVRGKCIPQLGFHMPVAYECCSYKYDIPFGVIERAAMDMDVPANSFVAGIHRQEGGKSVMLVTNTKYGFRGVDNSMSVTLIRSSYDPDPYPEFGIHRFSFSVGLVEDKSNKDLIGYSYNYNHPISVVSTIPHKGTLPSKNSFISLLEGSIAISCIKMPEVCSDGHKILIRVYETDGNKTKAKLCFFRNVKKASFIDVSENVIDPGFDIRYDADQLCFDVLPYSIASILIEF